MQNITILTAMQGEAEPLLKKLSLTEESRSLKEGLPFRLYKGTFGSSAITLLTSGTDTVHQVDNVATVPAALMTYLAIDHFNPDIIINSGTAGGIGKKGCAIGDVYLSAGTFNFHDRRIPIPGFEEYGLGSYPCYDTSTMAKALNLKTGAVSTGNSLDLLDRDMEIITSNEAIIKDMEAAAIAWVCRLFSVPMFAVKAITDLIDEQTPTEEQFLKNLQESTLKLTSTQLEILRYLEKH